MLSQASWHFPGSAQYGPIKEQGVSTWLRLKTCSYAVLDLGLGARLSQANFHLGFCVWCFLMDNSQPSGYLTSKKPPLHTETSIDTRLEAESNSPPTEKWAKLDCL